MSSKILPAACQLMLYYSTTDVSVQFNSLSWHEILIAKHVRAGRHGILAPECDKTKESCAHSYTA